MARFRDIRPPLATHTVVFSDTCDVAFGGFSVSLDGTVVSGMWEPEDIGQSSTFRELKAIYFLLLSYVAQLKHKRESPLVFSGYPRFRMFALRVDFR